MQIGRKWNSKVFGTDIRKCFRIRISELHDIHKTETSFLTIPLQSVSFRPQCDKGLISWSYVDTDKEGQRKWLMFLDANSVEWRKMNRNMRTFFRKESRNSEPGTFEETGLKFRCCVDGNCRQLWHWELHWFYWRLWGWSSQDYSGTEFANGEA